jgi:hypothetical protein
MVLSLVFSLLAIAVIADTRPAMVKGTFVLEGINADLKHVRATRTTLDEKGKKGYVVLVSEREATGDLASWKTADPKERGSFIHFMFEENGAIWVAELGHKLAKTGRFGVVMELKTVAFKVDGDRLIAHVETPGEQTSDTDHYTVDLTFEVPLEK